MVLTDASARRCSVPKPPLPKCYLPGCIVGGGWLELPAAIDAPSIRGAWRLAVLGPKTSVSPSSPLGRIQGRHNVRQTTECVPGRL